MQLSEQVSALPAQDAVQRFRITRLNGRHQLEEEVVAVTATVALGVLAVADVVFLNIRERAPELAAIRTFGWRETTLSRLVITEGAIIGLAGSLAEAALGLAAAAQLGGQLPATLYLIAAAAVVGGLLVTTTAALLPAQALRRLPAAYLLAEE